MLEVSDLVVRLGGVVVVDGVTFMLPDGPSGLGLVGESGSGKTTIARTIMGLIPADRGVLRFDGRDVTAMKGAALKEFRRSAQIVLQDPDGALDPRMRIGPSIREVLQSHHSLRRADMAARVHQLLNEVGLQETHARALPHQISGGQRQRVAIAKALAVGPRVLVLDEPTSAVDVTAQARLLDLIRNLRSSRSLAYLLISHNLAIVEQLCERVMVLYLGRVAESGPTTEVLSTPAHPYTAALRSAVPQIGSAKDRSGRIILEGTLPDPAFPPSGCVFRTRCPIAIPRCAGEVPPLREIAPGRLVACHRASEVLEHKVDLTRAVPSQTALRDEQSGADSPLNGSQVLRVSAQPLDTSRPV